MKSGEEASPSSSKGKHRPDDRELIISSDVEALDSFFVIASMLCFLA